PTVTERAHLLGVRLHHRFADGHLAIAAERDLPIAADGDDRGRADTWQSVVHVQEDTLPVNSALLALGHYSGRVSRGPGRALPRLLPTRGALRRSLPSQSASS